MDHPEPRAQLAGMDYLNLPALQHRLCDAYFDLMRESPRTQFIHRMVAIDWHGPSERARISCRYGVPMMAGQGCPLGDGFMCFLIGLRAPDGSLPPLTARLDVPMPAWIFNALYPQSALDVVRACEHCGATRGLGLPPDAIVRLCTRCKSAPYCSKACQTFAWRAYHKKQCDGRRLHYADSRLERRRLRRASAAQRQQQAPLVGLAPLPLVSE